MNGRRIMTAEEMGLSKEILQLCHLSKGLVLITGPTGSGRPGTGWDITGAPPISTASHATWYGTTTVASPTIPAPCAPFPASAPKLKR